MVYNYCSIYQYNTVVIPSYQCLHVTLEIAPNPGGVSAELWWG